jgi:large subunit ribosomal protein L24
MISTKARKQRKAFFNAPLHQRRKQLSSHLEENLLLKYDKRRIPVVKGDTVKIMRGAFKGHENKVTQVHLKKQRVEIEGVTLTKADGKQIAKPVHPSNLLITKLNLTDKWRRQRLEEGLSSETKKEIEKEASTQLKELEEQRKREEELRKQAEEAAAAEEEPSEEEETVEPKETTEEKPAKKPETEVKKKQEPKATTDAEPKEESKKEEQSESKEDK